MRSTHLRHSAHEISPLLRLSSISLACELSKPPSSLASLRGCLRLELDACFATSGGMGAESKGGCYRKGGAVSGQGRTSRLWLILVVSVRAVLVYQLCTDLLAMGQSRGERGSDTCSDLSHSSSTAPGPSRCCCRPRPSENKVCTFHAVPRSLQQSSVPHYFLDRSSTLLRRR